MPGSWLPKSIASRTSWRALGRCRLWSHRLGSAWQIRHPWVVRSISSGRSLQTLAQRGRISHRCVTTVNLQMRLAHTTPMLLAFGESSPICEPWLRRCRSKILGGGAFGGVPLVLAGPDCTSSLGDGHPKEFCGSSTAWRAPHVSATLDDRAESASFPRLARLVGEMDATLRTDLAILLHRELDKFRREIMKVPENIPAAETRGSASAGSLPRKNNEMKRESTAAKLGSEWRAAINVESRHVSLAALAKDLSPAPLYSPRGITHRAGSQVGPPQLLIRMQRRR
mmetsp:Transcript_93756/g.244647  ORF Transcript_93756/g.244647 Transcript_93756/m.244647 type:complete len:283 (+) Transcript_93756:181-1029(+)